MVKIQFPMAHFSARISLFPQVCASMYSKPVKGSIVASHLDV